jgi:hypothetical protein
MVKRKSKKLENEGLPDGLLQWLYSPEVDTYDQATYAVNDSLEGSSVDPDQRVIVWNDGKRLSIKQTARRIQRLSKLPLSLIEFYVIGWLESVYEPQGLTEKQLERFEGLIEDWIQDHESAHPESLNPD